MRITDLQIHTNGRQAPEFTHVASRVAIIAGTLVTVNDATVTTVLENFRKCDPKYGELIKTALVAAKQKHAATPPAGR